MALIKSISLKGVPGLSFVQNDLLRYARIITVTREGLGYDITTSNPGNRQARHVSADGKVEFENAFIGEFEMVGSRRILKHLETVNITYER